MKAKPSIYGESLVVSGKRKTAIAKASIKPGSGIIRINRFNVETFPYLRRIYIQEPLLIAKSILGKIDFDISVRVKGSGPEAQAEAARLAIAKSVIAYKKSAELKKAFLNYDRNMLIADVRRKEQRKPGDSKARACKQWSRR